jgi:AraC-like DNA-binding protein
MHPRALRDDAPDRALEQSRIELAALIERYTGGDGTHSTAFAPLVLFRASAPSEPVHSTYEPALCIVAQGSKQVLLADELYRYDPVHFLLVSVDLPIVGQVVEATAHAPYLGLRLGLDPAQIGALIVEADLPAPSPRSAGRALAVSRLDVALLDAMARLLRLLETPEHLRMLAPPIVREILYRLLVGEQGARLRHIALGNSQTQRIGKAIDLLKRRFAEPLRIDDLASAANMSASGLHHHFKAVTAMSPLQYQKHLRLQEARRLMLGEDLDAATAGFRVGYESPSQFSREYRRLFGAPPLRDIARLRTASWNGADTEPRAVATGSTERGSAGPPVPEPKGASQWRT